MSPRLQPPVVCLTLLVCLFVSRGALCTDGGGREKSPAAETTEHADRRPSDSRAEATSSRSSQPPSAADLQPPVAASSRHHVLQAAAAASAPSHGLMVVPPVSLMLAMPHPSGRFLMLIPMSNLVPMVGSPPYRRSHQSGERAVYSPAASSSEEFTEEHPAVFAARYQQILYPAARRAPASSGHHSQAPRDFYPSQPYPGSHHYHNQRISSDET